MPRRFGTSNFCNSRLSPMSNSRPGSELLRRISAPLGKVISYVRILLATLGEHGSQGSSGEPAGGGSGRGQDVRTSWYRLKAIPGIDWGNDVVVDGCSELPWQ